MDIQALFERTALRTLELSNTFPEGSDIPGAIRWYRWDWSIGVAFYGVMKAYEHSHNESYLMRMKEWIDARIEQKIPKICINTNALLLTLLKINEKYPDSRYESVLKTFDQYLMSEGLRTPSQALEHTVIDNNWGLQVWADTVFMSLLYMTHRGIQLSNQSMVDEAMFQLDLHNKLLFDPKEKLFYHGWDDNKRKHIGVHWGRGNAWMTAGMVEILELTGSDSALSKEISGILHQQLEKLSELQHPSGLWRTVMNSENTYLETSVTAGIAYGVLKGVRLGIVDPNYLIMGENALSALLHKVDEEGNVTGGSSGTPVKANEEAYNQIPYEITPFTQGLALLAMSEGLKLKSGRDHS
ncbi:glycoside hydrolase family 88/105 protein [Paenibacillus aceris]|uniref:Unsaturated rhamnogalacturonyl hydrolase n=1 Tax=Paenibacillus aceris TaxID=869555 RepID=A0ABS4HZZ4_9BACL|nr:glycoside hydrolase family 88 protein [Paenibacillus aceris]MBP1964252.1 unsaturated rhamnogalacturonyl hydrolase [Paenibacillus aceris]NHW36575.1 hypothetical protein [Paenibacillus aceris]